MSEWVLNTCRAFFLNYLFSITLFNREHFTPQLDACCLRFRTTSPGKSFQGLIVPADPIFITLKKNTASSFNTILPYSCIVVLGIKNTHQKNMACLFNYYAA